MAHAQHALGRLRGHTGPILDRYDARESALVAQIDSVGILLCAMRRSVGAPGGHDPTTALTGQFPDQVEVAVVVQDDEIVLLGSCCDE